MAKRVKKKIKKTDESSLNTEHKVAADATVYDSPELLQDQIGRSQQYLEKNKKTVTGIAIALVAVLVVAFGINTYQESKETEAQAELAPAIFFFEKDSLSKALDGDNNSTSGFLAIADDHSSTDAGNLANFYIGASYLQMGKFDDAIQYLQDFSTSDPLVQSRAYSLVGDAYMEKEDFPSAIDFYEKAANYKPTAEFTPAYMMKLGLAYELNNEPNSAKDIYSKLVQEYPQAREINNAKKYLAQF